MKSFLSYLGGKSLLAGKIIPKFPEHTCYVEVFAGAAWLLFGKEESEVEVLNDINTDLITLYRVVKNHLDEFIRYLRWILVSRDEFARFKAERPETLTDIQRAVRFYYLLRCGFSSRIDNPSFATGTVRRPNLNLLRIEEDLSAAHLRLAQVYIENLHYEKLIERYDRPHTLFYIDPPYHGVEDYYGKNIFFPEDFAKLAGILKGVKGKFVMSINDTPKIRSIYNQYNIEEVGTSYNVNGKKKKKVTELLIRNF